MPKTGVFNSITDSQLIKLIEQNPIFYDPDHHLAKNIPQRNQIWRSISDKLNLPVNVLKRRWTKLSSSYLKRCDNITSGKPHEIDSTYNGSLSFLSKFSLQSSNKDTDHVFVSEEEIVDSLPRPKTEPQDSQLIGCGSTPVDTPVPHRILRQRRSEPVQSTSKGSIQKTSRMTKRRRTIAVAGRKQNKNLLSKVDDEMYNFFENTTSTVARFPRYLQATVKQQICQVVTEIELKLVAPQI